MDDGKRQSHWVKSLDQAGLLDEIEDGWSLPGDPSAAGATIRVDGIGGKTIPPLADDKPSLEVEDRAVSRQQGSVDIAIVDDVPRTPIERHRSSHPDTRRAAPGSNPPLAVSSVRATHSGLPRPSRPPPPAELPSEPPPRREAPASDAPREPAPTVSLQREHVHGARTRISVAPGDEWSRRANSLAPIVDEPPPPRGAKRRASRPPKLGAADTRFDGMRGLLELGDYSGALDAAEAILKVGPDDSEAARVRDECRRRLMAMYESRIGAFDRVPAVAVSPNELIWRNLDASTGFVLSRIDGMSTFEDVVDISGLPRFETCRILHQLLQDGIIR